MINMDASDFMAGIAEVEEKLDKAAEATRNMTPIWDELGRVFSEHQRNIFASGFDWAPLAASTVAKKGNAQILVETGSLMQGATNPIPVTSGPLFATFGVPQGHPSRAYAHWHYRGAGVPLRDPVPELPPPLRVEFLAEVQKRIGQALA